MGNGSLSSSNNQKNTNRHASIDKSDKYLALDFQYIDQNQVLIIENRVRFSPTVMIRAVVKEFLELDEQNVISPDKVILVAICLDGRCFPVPTNAVRMTLYELKIENRSLLCFEPLSVKDRAKLSRLTLFSPHDAAKKVYEWDEKSTLLSMLLKYVIEVFDLNSIKRDNIQLCTFLNENLNQSNNLGKTLNELDLRNYHSIFVTLIKSTSYNNNGQDIHIHVESSSHGEILLHASCMNTVTELEYQIARRFSHSDSIDIELSNAKYEKLDKRNPKRTLRELGIKSGETMNAIIREDTSNKQTTITNRRINRSQSSTNSLVVFVECTFLNHKPITIEVYVTDTVAEVTSKIAAFRKDQPIGEFYLYSESIDIDNKQPGRCLADFGIKPGSTIYANIGDINPTNTSLRSSSKYSVDSKPLGLVNLGNTCFMNSALQCLVHISPLTHFFLDAFARVHTDDNDWNPFDTSGEVTGAYADIIWNMRRLDRKNSDDVHSFKPIRMKETIGRIAPHFATSDQQDAQEFMIFLLDAINDELQDKNKSDRNTIIQQLFFGTMQSRITCLSCEHVTTTKNRFSFKK
jgi:hypothetical protein